MTCGIYCITAPDGKKYVGQSVNIERRWKDHQMSPKRTSRLIRSFSTYGVEGHQFEVLEECLEDDLLSLERQWQEKLNTCVNGLNVLFTTGNEKFGRTSDQAKANMSKAQSGVNNPNYGKRGAETSCYGRKRTKEERDAISAYQRTRGKLVCQIDLLTGQVIAKAKVRDFAKHGFSQGNILSCCNGRIKSYKGYQFQYEAAA
jgi:group I intron endonuclease